MNFGEEGELLKRKRAEEALLYAEDLRKQMEERNRKPPTPDFYSTSSIAGQPQYASLKNRFRPYQQAEYNYRNGGAASQMQPSYQPPQQTSLIRNQNPRSQSGLGDASPDVTPRNDQYSNNPSRAQVLVPTTNKRTSTLSHVSRFAEPLPDLPPSQLGPTPDAIRFADRLCWLESSVDQHQNILRAASECATRLERTAIPSLNDGVQQLRSALDRVATVDLPGRVRPLEEENARLEERITASANDYIAQAQGIRDKLNETGAVFNQTTQKFNEFSDSVKSALLEFKSDVARGRDSHDALAQRIAGSESRASQIEEALRSVNAALANFEKTASDSIANSQSQMNSSISAASLQIAEDIKHECDARDQATSVIHNQAEEVNQRIGSAVGNVQSVINDLSTSFRQSLSALSNSVRDALEDTRGNSDSKYQELSDRLDQMTADTDANFSTMQNEAISTLSAINDHATKSREALEAALTQECEIRRKNETQIAAKYENFMSLIVNEMQLQTSQMEENTNNGTANLIQSCNDQLIPLRTEVQAIRERTKGIDSIIAQADKTEKLISTLNTQLMENVATLGKQSSTIVSTIQKIRTESEDMMSNLGERLHVVEEQETLPQYASRQEVSDAFTRLGTEFDGRMQDIEQQIGVIFSSLSDLTMTLPAPKQEREAGTEILDKLAKDAVSN